MHFTPASKTLSKISRNSKYFFYFAKNEWKWGQPSRLLPLASRPRRRNQAVVTTHYNCAQIQYLSPPSWPSRESNSSALPFQSHTRLSNEQANDCATHRNPTCSHIQPTESSGSRWLERLMTSQTEVSHFTSVTADWSCTRLHVLVLHFDSLHLIDMQLP